MNADLQTIDGRPALRFERYLAHPVERVWRAVSEPAEVRRWMPAAADWTPELGETFELGGQHGQITELDPPHLIGWTFGADRFRCTLQPKGDGCALVFTHIFDDAAPAAQTAAGWECYLDRLDAQLDDQDLSEEAAHQPVGERHERYAARFGLDPAPGRAFIATLGFRGLTLEDGPSLRLERRYDQPVERVWRALTDPDELSRWFPGELDISHTEPPHVLVGGWQGDGTLRFELRPDGDGMRADVHPRLHRPRPGRADRGGLGPLLRPPRRGAGRPDPELRRLAHGLAAGARAARRRLGHRPRPRARGVRRARRRQRLKPLPDLPSEAVNGSRTR